MIFFMVFSGQNFKRRRIRKVPIQIRYTLLLTLVSAFTSLLTVFVTSWFIQRNYNLFMSEELGISSQVIEVVNREKKLLEFSLVVLFLFSVLISFISVFYVIRRLTGPILAFQRQLWLYANGEWGRTFKLRKKDEFQEFEELLNEVRTSHLQSIKRIRMKEEG